MSGPRHVRNMNQAVDALVQSHEGPKVRDALDFPLDLRAHRVAGLNDVPWIRCGLFHAQRNLATLLVHVQHLRVDGVSHRDHP